MHSDRSAASQSSTLTIQRIDLLYALCPCTDVFLSYERLMLEFRKISLSVERKMAGEIRKICAVGAGAMGSGTALCFAMAGFPVALYDVSETGLAKGMDNVKSSLNIFQAHGLVSESDIPLILSRFSLFTNLGDAASSADFIIESIFEDLSIKQKTFSELDDICPIHTIFATNTSGLSPTAIASAIKRKDRFVVTHFWNPPHLLPLVEVVPGAQTSEATVDIAYDLMLKIGKKPVRLKKECLGFVGNRMQAALLREAIHIVASGIASAEDVDAVMQYSLGRRLSVTGPIISADMGGLDVFRNIFSYLGADLCNETGVPEMLAGIVHQGDYGTKTGKGFYEWPQDKATAMRDARADELLRHMAEDQKEKQVGFGSAA